MHARRVKRAGMGGARHRNSDHKHRHRISVRTDSRRSSCGCRGELTEVRAERNVQRWASIFRQAVCTAQPLSRPGRNSVGWRRALCAAVSGIQQAQLTMPNGKFAIFRQATCAALPSSRPGQKLVGWGCAVGAAVFLYSKRGSRCMAENFYQLALRTPGIWPLYASSRKQIRQMP